MDVLFYYYFSHVRPFCCCFCIRRIRDTKHFANQFVMLFLLPQLLQLMFFFSFLLLALLGLYTFFFFFYVIISPFCFLFFFLHISVFTWRPSQSSNLCDNYPTFFFFLSVFFLSFDNTSSAFSPSDRGSCAHVHVSLVVATVMR
ncbi:hypothetical protein ABB37_00686 [Leptomonas pyrrhocoris]|uniref:Uncharacterized protein n=1 Tax=Leptomonas pyrrhocoris TaxID=157538 RepID=A0A0M9GB79_LEPPY|nr:hypothetical protein ABB37_00686 [Leptomonas pyrrhocoris]KPA86546.1 hypothetical protein ABB37_00686 [Leptomonas pyrrhocoris]|eukprot:XP_015664985.1 hypothetical protein ABB37_00686 [Leptomonas pyrrhocoris]